MVHQSRVYTFAIRYRVPQPEPAQLGYEVRAACRFVRRSVPQTSKERVLRDAEMPQLSILTTKSCTRTVRTFATALMPGRSILPISGNDELRYSGEPFRLVAAVVSEYGRSDGPPSRAGPSTATLGVPTLAPRS